MANFMDRLRGTMDQGLVSISAKSKELIEINKIKSGIRKLEQDRAERIRDLGETVYRMVRSSVLDATALEPLMQSVDSLDASIAAANTEIARLQAEARKIIEAARTFAEEPTATCSCGGQLRESSLFCPRCGRDVRQILAVRRSTQPPAARPQGCARCGRGLPPGSRYCAACGTPVPARPTPLPRDLG